MDVGLVADAVLYMAGLPLDANVLTLTVMATKMPFVGRGWAIHQSAGDPRPAAAERLGLIGIVVATFDQAVADQHGHIGQMHGAIGIASVGPIGDGPDRADRPCGPCRSGPICAPV